MLKYKEFRVGDLFDHVERGRRLVSKLRISGELPFVTAGDTNFGISDYIGNNDITVYPKNSLTIDMFGITNYRGYKFGADDHVTILYNTSIDYSDKVLQFIQTCISKLLIGKFSYSRNFYPKDSLDLLIKLPVDSNDKPDWTYMTKYIQQIEVKYVKQLEIKYGQKFQAYLSVISDDMLDDQKTQAILQQYNQTSFKQVLVSDIFVLNTTTAYKETKENLVSVIGNTPFISNNTSNNGIAGYVGFDANNKGHVITYSDTTNGGDTFFYQDDDFIGYSHVKRMQLLHGELDKFLAHYFITAIRKSVDGQFDWGTKLNNDALYNTKITVPVTVSGEPDYDLMRDYIKVIQQKYVDKLRTQLQQRLLTYQSLI